MLRVDNGLGILLQLALDGGDTCRGVIAVFSFLGAGFSHAPSAALVCFKRALHSLASTSLPPTQGTATSPTCLTSAWPSWTPRTKWAPHWCAAESLASTSWMDWLRCRHASRWWSSRCERTHASTGVMHVQSCSKRCVCLNRTAVCDFSSLTHLTF